MRAQLHRRLVAEVAPGHRAEPDERRHGQHHRGVDGVSSGGVGVADYDVHRYRLTAGRSERLDEYDSHLTSAFSSYSPRIWPSTPTPFKSSVVHFLAPQTRKSAIIVTIMHTSINSSAVLIC